MNKERLLMIADTIEKGYHHFNGTKAIFNLETYFDHVEAYEESNIERHRHSFTGRYVNPVRKDLIDNYEEVNVCNTTACIAGFAVLMFDDRFNLDNIDTVIHRSKPGNMPINWDYAGAKILDLDIRTADQLFTDSPLSSITGKQAARVIRNLVETGVVDWESATFPNEEDGEHNNAIEHGVDD